MRPESLAYVCIDLETTSRPPEENEIVEFAAVRVCNGTIVSEYEQLIRPKKPIPPFVSKLTGIEQHMLDSAPSFPEVLDQIRDFIGDAVIVAHPLDFDWMMLNRELQRHGHETLNNSGIDTQELLTIVYPSMSSYRLSVVAESLNIHLGDAHRALADTQCLAEIFIHLVNKVTQLPSSLRYDAIQLLSHPGHRALRDLFVQANSRRPLTGQSMLESIQEIQERLGEALPDLQAALSVDDAEDLSKLLLASAKTAVDQVDPSVLLQDCIRPVLAQQLSRSAPLVVSAGTTKQRDALYAQCQADAELRHLPIQCLDAEASFLDLSRLLSLYRYFIEEKQKGDKIEFLGLLHWALRTETGNILDTHAKIRERFGTRVTYLRADILSQVSERPSFYTRMQAQLRQPTLIISDHATLLQRLSTSDPGFADHTAILYLDTDRIHSQALDAASMLYTDRELKQLQFKLEDPKQEGLFQSIRRDLLRHYPDRSFSFKRSLVNIRRQIKFLESQQSRLFRPLKKRYKENKAPFSEQEVESLAPKLAAVQDGLGKLEKELEAVWEPIQGLQPAYVAEFVFMLIQRISEMRHRVGTLLEKGEMPTRLHLEKRGHAWRLLRSPAHIRDYLAEILSTHKYPQLFASRYWRVPELGSFIQSELGSPLVASTLLSKEEKAPIVYRPQPNPKPFSAYRLWNWIRKHPGFNRFLVLVDNRRDLNKYLAQLSSVSQSGEWEIQIRYPADMKQSQAQKSVDLPSNRIDLALLDWHLDIARDVDMSILVSLGKGDEDPRQKRLNYLQKMAPWQSGNWREIPTMIWDEHALEDTVFIRQLGLSDMDHVSYKR